MLIKISQKTAYEHNTAQPNTDDHYEFTIIYTTAQGNTIQSRFIYRILKCLHK